MHVRAEQLPGASSEVAAVLYRVARETLANVAKHAQASAVEIDLGPDRASPTPSVMLRVADDGIGIRPDQLDKRAEGHLGLRLLIDRIADQGGSLTIEARPEGGTVALASVPVPGSVNPAPPTASPTARRRAAGGERHPGGGGTPQLGGRPTPTCGCPSSPSHTD